MKTVINVIKYSSSEKFADAWNRGKIKGTAECWEDGEMLTAHEDVILCGETIRLLVARNRRLGCVFALTSRKICGGWAFKSVIRTVEEAGCPIRHKGGYIIVWIDSFVGWNPLNCNLAIARKKMMETFRNEAQVLLEEWESLQPREGLLLRRAELEWERLAAMLPRLGETVPPEYEERRIANKMRLRLLGEPLPIAGM